MHNKETWIYFSDWESVTRAFLKYLINMKLSTFCILCCLSAGLSQAATYVWSGAAGNGIYGDSNNWTVNGAPNGYYPQSDSDNAVIGKNAGTITWSTSQSYFGATDKVIIDSGSILLCTTEIGDLNVNSFTLKGNSQLIFESSNALGLGRDFTLNFSTFTAEEHGSWVATNLPSFWSNGKPSSSSAHWIRIACPGAELLSSLPLNLPNWEAISIWIWKACTLLTTPKFKRM